MHDQSGGSCAAAAGVRALPVDMHGASKLVEPPTLQNSWHLSAASLVFA
jgi:hypothetical protein